jgi:beta-lactamase class A
MKNKFVSSSFILFILCCAAFRISGQADEQSRSMNQPVEPFKIIGNIYYVGTSDVTSFLITTENGHILIDGGYAETVPQIKQNILKLGFRLEDVKILLNSHAHLDHAGGLAELKELTGARLFASQPDSLLLANGGKGDFSFGDRLPYTPVKADKILRDNEKVKLGGMTLKANLTPGHTKGCTTWTTTVFENKQKYNAVFVCSTTAPGYRLVDNQNYPNIARDYQKTFRKLKKIKADVFLASHGNFFDLTGKTKKLQNDAAAINPFVDPQGYSDFINKTEQAFQEKLREQQNDKRQTADLHRRVAEIAQNSKGRVGIAAMLLETGESIALNGGERFPMQSVFKLPIGMTVLREVDARKIKLDQVVSVEKSDIVGKHLRSPIRDKFPDGTELSVSELLRLMVSESDGTACDVLLKLIGGPATVNKYLREFKIREMNVVNNEKEIGADNETQYRNYATPESAISLLRVLHEEKTLAPPSRTLLLKLMVETPTGQKRLKSLLPKEAIVAHKTGTSNKVDGKTAATNDIGLITLPDGRNLAVAVFVSDSPADEATREAVIAKIARAVWDRWSYK